MDDKPKKIIIKRVKKGHEGHHGGSWKVAYADFVTAMMAFFLLMWLLNMSAQEKRAVLALYFKNFSLFEKGGKSFMMEGGSSPSAQKQSGGQDVLDAQEMTQMEQTPGGGLTEDATAAKLISGISDKAQPLGNQVMVAATPEGIRIQIVDTQENPIFPPGTPQLTEVGKSIIKLVAAILKNFPNEIAVEGHTDASPTKSEQTSNWELSTARASAARKELELSGIHPSRIARVVGFADKVPLIKDAPEDPRNRRISILFVKGRKQKPPEQYEWLWKSPPHQ